MTQKPIMSAEVERQCLNAAAQWTARNQWKKWGMMGLRKQGAGILLKGPPGCGKTTIATWLSLKVRKKGMKELSFADFGSHVPGENARQIRENFDYAKENGDMTIFLDECEAVLWDRSRAGSTAMWMLEVIDELLAQIGKYRGLVILATNKDELLDSGIQRRMLAEIYIGVPDRAMRLALWTIKMPAAFPIKLTIEQKNKLADLVLTGAEIETAIINCASDAMRLKKNPTVKQLFAEAQTLAARRQAQGPQGGVVS